MRGGLTFGFMTRRTAESQKEVQVPSIQRFETLWLGVWDDFRNWLLTAA